MVTGCDGSRNWRPLRSEMIKIELYGRDSAGSREIFKVEKSLLLSGGRRGLIERLDQCHKIVERDDCSLFVFMKTG